MILRCWVLTLPDGTRIVAVSKGREMEEMDGFVDVGTAGMFEISDLTPTEELLDTLEEQAEVFFCEEDTRH